MQSMFCEFCCQFRLYCYKATCFLKPPRADGAVHNHTKKAGQSATERNRMEDAFSKIKQLIA